MKRIWIGIVVALSTIFSGCAAVTKPVVSPSPMISEIITGLKSDTTSLTQTTATIKTNVADGQTATPDASKVLLQPYWVNILVAAGIQDAIVKDLQNEVANATTAKTQADKLAAVYTTLQTQYNQLKIANVSAYHTVSIIAFGLGLLAIAVGVVLSFEGFLPGKIIGIAGAVLAVTSLIFGLITNVLDQINIYVIFGVLVATVGGVVWYLIKNRTIAAVATKETAVVTVENTKLKLDHAKLMIEHDALKATLTSLHTKLIDVAFIAKTNPPAKINPQIGLEPPGERKKGGKDEFFEDECCGKYRKN